MVAGATGAGFLLPTLSERREVPEREVVRRVGTVMTGVGFSV